MNELNKIPQPSEVAPLFPALGAPEGFVFVFGVGLAGDLLVQRLLNSQSGVCIRGENGDVLSKIMGAWFDAEARTHKAMTAPNADVAGLMREVGTLGRRLAEAFAKAVLAPPVGARLSGFREVRYLEPDVSIADQLRFLYAFFPGARFVFCLRDPEAIARTGWWRKVPREELVQQLSDVQDGFRKSAADWPSRSCVLQLEDIVQEPEKIRPLFTLLDLPFDSDAVDRLVRHVDLNDPEAEL
ncbi:sulfotransferase [Paracoccus aestuariivivens]|nr:sulfotransferase [Paracoccus aestuariivivens]